MHMRWQGPVKCCKMHAEDPIEQADVQTSWTQYIVKCVTYMVNHILQKRILCPRHQ